MILSSPACECELAIKEGLKSLNKISLSIIKNFSSLLRVSGYWV